MRTYQKTVSALVLAAIGLSVLISVNGATEPASKNDHEIHIAFGFHVNLYHSFRNDTNDETGFGKDIRIIRQIIDTLDRYNANGVPVKGVWDFDNLFSLQEILPRYAPDIITDIRRRVRFNGDEVILMSYNNGLASAMTEQELNDAMRWAVSNPWGSGVRDLFGTYSPIVRPQEMMTTPGNFEIYRKQGMEAVALYYSATPFDAFRVFSRPLTRTEAHNPIRYRNPQTGEEIVVIPTYHFGDLVEHVSLRNWVAELQSLQSRKELDSDALIFINFDADSELWSGVDLPSPLQWLPNTRGLAGLIEEVADLDQVRFTTLRSYLENHPPVGAFHFRQDTADGSYNGYNSWAEKSEAARNWTKIERNRRMCSAANEALAYLDDPQAIKEIESLQTFADLKRLRAMSTTHFGMATPFLAHQREQVAMEIMDDLDDTSDRIAEALRESLRQRIERNAPPPPPKDSRLIWRDTLMLLPTGIDAQNNTNRFLRVIWPEDAPDGDEIFLMGSDGRLLPSIIIDIEVGADGRRNCFLYVNDEKGPGKGIYHLFTRERKQADRLAENVRADSAELSNKRIAVRFDTKGRVEGIYLDNVRQAAPGSLAPRLKYDGQVFFAKTAPAQVRKLADGRVASVRLNGDFPGPPEQTQSKGSMDYRLAVFADRPYLLVQGRLAYPATTRGDMFKKGHPGLTRREDLAWQEVAPAELLFAPRTSRQHPLRIIKRNYLGVESEYRLDYFRHHRRNLELDNVNNHITSSFVALVAENRGMAVAKDNSVLSNFAFAPLKMNYHVSSETFSASVNPFGTYHGRQYLPPTWGNRHGYEATLLAGEQFASSGPTYNGQVQQFALLFAFFEGDRMPPEIKEDLIAFSNAPLAVSARGGSRLQSPSENPPVPRGLSAAYLEDGKVRFSWDSGDRPGGHYRIDCGARPGRYEQVYAATGSSIVVDGYAAHRPFLPGNIYYARIKAVSGGGRESAYSDEIRFVAKPVAKRDRPNIPLNLQIEIVWANLRKLF